MATPETLTGSFIPEEIKAYLGTLERSEQELRKDLIQEYSIAALFTLGQLKTLLKRKDIIQEGRLVYISSGIASKPAKVLVKKGDTYVYFDLRYDRKIKIKSLDEVAERIFKDNGFDKDKRLPLGLRMFFNGEPSTVKYPEPADVLEEIKPDADSFGSNKLYTSLMIAAKTGCVESVRYFLETRKVDPNTVNKDNWTAFMFAAMDGHLKVVEAILKDPTTELDVKAENGETAFLLASANGHDQVVRILLERGIDVKIKSGINDWTTAMWAARNGHVEVIRELLKKEEINFNLTDKEGNTPLMIAAKFGHHNVVEEILKDPKIKTNITNGDNETAFLLASKNGDDKIIHEFLQREGINFAVRDKDSDTALMVAVKSGNFEIVKELLDHKDKIGLNLKEYGYKLRGMYGFGMYSEVLQPMESAVKVDLKDGQTALMMAVKEGKSKIAKLLIEKGANINAGFDIKSEDRGRWLGVGGIGLGLLIALPALVVAGIAAAGTIALMLSTPPGAVLGATLALGIIGAIFGTAIAVGMCVGGWILFGCSIGLLVNVSRIRKKKIAAHAKLEEIKLKVDEEPSKYIDTSKPIQSADSQQKIFSALGGTVKPETVIRIDDIDDIEDKDITAKDVAKEDILDNPLVTKEEKEATAERRDDNDKPSLV